jgi:hypothetical protein
MHIAIFTMLASFLVVPAAMAQHTYYISSSAGSDSNTSAQAQSKTTPWQHLKGMPGASGNANAYSPVAGDQFVFMGCDTWTFNSEWSWSSSGSSGNLIAIGGLDQSWFNTSVCPTTWNRPIFTGGGSWPASAGAFMLHLSATYVNVAWIEWTGFYYSPSGCPGEMGIIERNGGNDIFHDNYFHGWSHAAGACESENVNAIYGGSSTDRVYNNAFDGADTDHVSFGGLYCTSSCGEVDHNYFAYQNDTMNFDGTMLIHDNTFYNAGTPAYSGSGDHNNVMESNQDPSGGMIVYNNYYTLDNGGAGGSGVAIQIAPPAGATSYFFNNVITNGVNSGNNLMCEQSISNPGGTCFFFNNTEECGPDSLGAGDACLRVGGLSGTMPTAVETNMQLITSTSPIAQTTPLVQSLSVTNLLGLVLGETYSFAPTSASSPTVLAGTNMSSTCATIAAVNAAAGTACQSDTTYGVVYNSANHQVTGSAKTAVLRPTSGPWDIGAYQFGGASSVTKPNPPTGVSAVAH